MRLVTVSKGKIFNRRISKYGIVSLYLFYMIEKFFLLHSIFLVRYSVLLIGGQDISIFCLVKPRI